MKNAGQNAISAYLALVLAVLSAIGTIVGLATQFGLAGAFFLGALNLFVVTLALSAKRWPRILPARLRKLWRFVVRKRAEKWSCGVGLLLLIVAGALWFAGWGDARLWRSEFAQHHNALQIEEVDFGINQFAEPVSEDLGTQQSREREAMMLWIQWMVRGAEEERKVEPPPGSSDTSQTVKHISLICASSVQFDGRYDTTHLTIQVSNRLRVIDGVAFLVAGIDQRPWWKPTWRQMSVVPRRSGTSVDIVATNPNPGERLIAFLQVEPTGRELPPADRLIPLPIFEVRK